MDNVLTKKKQLITQHITKKKDHPHNKSDNKYHHDNTPHNKPSKHQETDALDKEQTNKQRTLCIYAAVFTSMPLRRKIYRCHQHRPKDQRFFNRNHRKYETSRQHLQQKMRHQRCLHCRSRCVAH